MQEWHSHIEIAVAVAISFPHFHASFLPNLKRNCNPDVIAISMPTKDACQSFAVDVMCRCACVVNWSVLFAMKITFRTGMGCD